MPPKLTTALVCLTLTFDKPIDAEENNSCTGCIEFPDLLKVEEGQLSEALQRAVVNALDVLTKKALQPDG